MCFGSTTTRTPAEGFDVQEGCGGFYLVKVVPAVAEKRNTIAWFETKQAAVDASYKK